MAKLGRGKRWLVWIAGVLLLGGLLFLLDHLGPTETVEAWVVDREVSRGGGGPGLSGGRGLAGGSGAGKGNPDISCRVVCEAKETGEEILTDQCYLKPGDEITMQLRRGLLSGHIYVIDVEGGDPLNMDYVF